MKISKLIVLNNRVLKVTIVLHIFTLVLSACALFAVVLLPIMGYFPVYKVDADILFEGFIILGIGSLFGIMICFLWPHFGGWHNIVEDQYLAENEILVGHGLRISFPFSVTFLGFIYGLLGGNPYLCVVFTSISIFSLIIIYPTDKRIAKWIRRKYPEFKGDQYLQ